MNIEYYRDYCLKKNKVTESFPFDENTLVFKVINKMFALTDINDFLFINLKCDPERSLELRAEYDEIRPAYHMNKKHWNSLYLDGRLSDQMIEKLIDHSYEIVVRGLPKITQKLIITDRNR